MNSNQTLLDAFSWDIDLVTPGYLKDPPIEVGVQQFISKYNISDRAYNIQVFKKDCITSSSGLPLFDTIDNKTDHGNNLMEALFIYNQSTIQQSNLWTANKTGGDAEFCIRLSLYTSSSSNPILFNFLEIIYAIQVDLTSGFSTSIDIVRTVAGDGGVDTIDTEENITVYQCDDSYNEIPSPPALTQGDSLQLCVETDDESPFEVSKVKDVTVSQNGTMSFDYVASFVDSYWADSSCQDVNTAASVCKVKMQLLGEYFSDANPVELTVEGVVKMDYLGRRRRHLVVDEEEEGHYEEGVIGSGSGISMTSRDLQDVGGTFKYIVPLSSIESSELVDSGEEFVDEDSNAYGMMYVIIKTVVLMATVKGVIMMIVG